MGYKGDGRNSFLAFVKENDFRIYKQMNKLGIKNFQAEFFQEGLVYLWRIYLSVDNLDRFNFASTDVKIRHRLSDMQRGLPDYRKRQGIFALYTVKENAVSGLHILSFIQARMTLNQWNWIYFHFIHEKKMD